MTGNYKQDQEEQPTARLANEQIQGSESKDMSKLEATFRIVTPMFIGGANQDVKDGIRPPSIKGALRFWWRALNWGRFQQANQSDEPKALRELHKEEARLFGAARDESRQTGGQGCFLLSIAPSANTLQHTPTDKVHRKFAGCDGSRYLAYGLVTAFSSSITGRKAGQLERACLDEDQLFTARLLFRGAIEPSIQEALIAFGLLGGLGSRSRHGMGSIALESLVANDREIWAAPETPEDYTNKVATLFSKYTLASNSPPFSTFSAESRIDCLLSGNHAFQVLDGFGRNMLFYRSWGKNGEVLGETSEKKFKNDHDWSKATLTRDNQGAPSWNEKYAHIPYDFHPQRVVFGLPHNYGKPKQQQVTPTENERRASPLLFHVHPLSTRNFVGISILLKSDFLPKGKQINSGGTEVPANIDWSLLTTFLDGLDAKGKKRFPSAKRLNLSGVGK